MEARDFVAYEQALALKELGFDEFCIIAYYHLLSEDKKDKLFIRYNDNKTNLDNAISAPTFSQAFRWFREKHQLFSWVKVEYEYGGTSYGLYITGVRQSDIANGPFTTYEEAELECLIKLIELVKKQK